jgi:flagellar basal-body rod protein FlgC
VYGALDISVSGLVAQRTRLNVITSNIANSGAVLDASGEPNPYQRRIAMFAPGGEIPGGRPGESDGRLGVRVAEIALDTAPFRAEWDPTHPAAAQEDDPERGVKKGYVYYPNVDREVEMVNALQAMRSYEANIAAADATKSMMSTALRLIA